MKSDTLEHIDKVVADELCSPAPSVEKSLRRKFDNHILPIVFFLFFFSFMDRSNVGNASIAGLNKDLKLVGHQYNVALALFFVVYLVVDIPAAWIFKWAGPRYFLGSTILLWGICCIGMGFATKAVHLYAIRCLLGFFEGGLTGCLYIYLAMFYRRYELQMRVAAIYVSAPLSSATGGLLASGLGKIRYGGYNGWPWIFFIEGAMTVVWGIVALTFLPNLPSQCSFLTEEEVNCAKMRLGDSDESVDRNIEEEVFAWRKVRQGLFDWNTIVLSIASIGTYANVYAYSLFSPTIIKQFGFSVIHSQLLSVPPYVVAAITIFIVAHLSDKLHMRSPFLLGACAVQSIGWILNIACKTAVPRYFGLFLIATGAFGGIPPLATWLSNNLHPYYSRATGMSISVSAGTCGGIITTFTYLSTSNPVQGNAVQLGMCGLYGTCAVFLMWKTTKENRLRASGGRDYRLTEGKVPEYELGSRHPSYRLTI